MAVGAFHTIRSLQSHGLLVAPSFSRYTVVDRRLAEVHNQYNITDTTATI